MAPDAWTTGTAVNLGRVVLAAILFERFVAAIRYVWQRRPWTSFVFWSISVDMVFELVGESRPYWFALAGLDLPAELEL